MKLSKWETSLFFTMLLLKHNECIYDYIEERGQNFLKIYLRNIWMSPKIFWSVTLELFWLEDQTIWVLVPMLSETSDLAPSKYLLCSSKFCFTRWFILTCQGLLLKSQILKLLFQGKPHINTNSWNTVFLWIVSALK